MKKITIVITLILSLFWGGLDVKAAEGDIVGPDIIYKQYDKVLTLSTIKSLYQSDQDISVTLDEYTGYGDIPAIYDITLETALSSKNIQISVRQTLGNVIAVTKTDDDYTIHVYRTTVLSKQDITDILVRINYITVTSTTQIFALTNTYTENATAPGTYLFEFMLATTSGLESTHQVNIKVSNSEELTPDIEIEPPTQVNVAFIFTAEFWIALSLFVVLMITFIKMKKKKG